MPLARSKAGGQARKNTRTGDVASAGEGRPAEQERPGQVSLSLYERVLWASMQP